MDHIRLQIEKKTPARNAPGQPCHEWAAYRMKGMADFREATACQRGKGARSRPGRIAGSHHHNSRQERNGHGTHGNRTHARCTQRHARRTRRASFCLYDANAKRAARSIRTATCSAGTKKDFRRLHSCRNDSSRLCDSGRLCGEELAIQRWYALYSACGSAAEPADADQSLRKSCSEVMRRPVLTALRRMGWGIGLDATGAGLPAIQ